MNFINGDVVAYNNIMYRVIDTKKHKVKLYNVGTEFWCNDIENITMLTKNMNIDVTIVPPCISSNRENQYRMQTINAYLYYGLEDNMKVIYEDERNVNIIFYR